MRNQRERFKFFRCNWLRVSAAGIVIFLIAVFGCGGGGGGGDGGGGGVPPDTELALGSWSGNGISFTVNQGSYLVDDLSVTYSGRAVGTICSYNYETTSNIGTSMLVENNSFSYDTDSLSIDGIFIDKNSAEIDVNWSKYNPNCDATESGSGVYYADYEGAQDAGDTSVRFYNTLRCGNASFTATLNVCGSSLSSVSESWSSCKKVASGSCPVSLHVTSTSCPPIHFDGTETLDPDCIYNWILFLDGSNVVLGYNLDCPGDCNSPAPISAAGSFRHLTADESFEVLMEIPIDDQDFERYQ